ncbi:MAG: GYD domain-containing protein [Dehalococcoidia bacterium]
MPKFMFAARYTPEGLDGTIKEGFAAREQYIRSLIEDLGGTVEVFYWAYGETDTLLIVDAPAPVAMAFAMAVSSREDALEIITTPLLTAAEMEESRALLPQFRSPGD